MEETPMEKGLSADGIKPIIEALLFVSKEPLSLGRMKRILGDEFSLGESQLAAMIEEIKIEYINSRHSFRIVEVAEGFQLRTRPRFAHYIMRLFKYDRAEKLSPAALETLAVVAYRQPVVRSEVESIRGVDVSGALRTLCEKGLVKVTGQRDAPGKPLEYATTPLFLEHFGLKTIDDLPGKAELGKITGEVEQMTLTAPEDNRENNPEDHDDSNG